MDYGQIKNQVLTCLRALNSQLFEVTGKSRIDGSELRILYAGAESFRHYFSRLAFAGDVRAQFKGRTAPWQLQTRSQKGSYDLLLFRSHRIFAELNFCRDGFFVPEWLSGETDLIAQSRLGKTSKSRRRDTNLLRRNRLHYTVTTAPDELGFFFTNMYVPHIRRSHGEAALLMSYDQMMSRVRRDEAELVLIWQDDQRIAGSLIVYDDGQPRLFSEGVLGAGKDYLRLGAGSAIYLFSFEHLLKRGFRRAHLGRSRAFLNDGVLYFKERFGLEVTEASDTGMFVVPGWSSAGAAAFVRNNPFIYVRGRQLRGAVFKHQAAPGHGPARTTVYDRMTRLGLESIDLLDFPVWGQPNQRTSNVSVAHSDS